MKRALIGFAVITFISCTSTNNNKNNIESNKKNFILSPKISNKIDSFLNIHNRYTKNDGIESIIMDSLSDFYISEIKNNIYDSLPLMFDEVERFQSDGNIGYLISLKTNWDKVKMNYAEGAKRLEVQVLSIINKGALDTLKQGNFYYIKGKFKKKLGNTIIYNNKISLLTVRGTLTSLKYDKLNN